MKSQILLEVDAEMRRLLAHELHSQKQFTVVSPNASVVTTHKPKGKIGEHLLPDRPILHSKSEGRPCADSGNITTPKRKWQIRHPIELIRICFSGAGLF